MLLFYVVAFVLFCLLLFYLYNFAIIKTKARLAEETNRELHAVNLKLAQENIEYQKLIERLNADLEHSVLREKEKNKIAEISFLEAKSALFELGNQLSEKLLVEHKRETVEVKLASEKQIELTVTKFQNEFERLVNMVSVLHGDVSRSTEVVEFIKTSLLSPTASGKLAEITLENMLKSSGLRSNIDFRLQYVLADMDKNKLRPDAVIFLPGNRLMVVDAKASRFLVNGESSESLSRSMNHHLKSLASKEYAENLLSSVTDPKNKFTQVITLMFLPTEHAVEKISDADPTFLERAWSSGIVPVGPAGLMNMLSFAKFQIADQLRSENHKMILEEVRKLLSSLSSLSEHSHKLGNGIQNLVSHYDKFAASFNRNLLSKARQLQKLGIESGSKNLPEMLERYRIIMNKTELLEQDTENPS
jgi:DNA recombination protein RmuC